MKASPYRRSRPYSVLRTLTRDLGSCGWYRKSGTYIVSDRPKRWDFFLNLRVGGWFSGTPLLWCVCGGGGGLFLNLLISSSAWRYEG